MGFQKKMSDDFTHRSKYVYSKKRLRLILQSSVTCAFKRSCAFQLGNVSFFADYITQITNIIVQATNIAQVSVSKSFFPYGPEYENKSNSAPNVSKLKTNLKVLNDCHIISGNYF
jgi:hypothetical protein